MLRSLLNRIRKPDRRVLVHAHLFKNAGTTFDWSLRRSFGESFFDHRDDDDMKQGASYLGPWLETHPEYRALSSHWITPPLPQLARQNISLCLFFRDPIERMRSVYRFERAQEGVDTPGSIRAKQMSFAEYIEWQFQPMPGPVVKNFHTRYCSGDYLGEDLDASFERARELVTSLPAFGLVHRYDESVVLMEQGLVPHFPELDLSYVRQNVSGSGNSSMPQRRQVVLDELGELAERALEMNQFDLRLFELAERRFDQLLQQVPELDTRLAELRDRCEALKAEGADVV